jgi:hypothetical protein
MNGMTIELAPFEIATDVQEAQLSAASRRLETDFLAHAGGYVGRLLLAKGEGRYLDLVFWRTKADAESAMEAAMQSEACRAYFACMKGAETMDAGTGVEHYGVVGAFGEVADLIGVRTAA